MRLNLSPAPKVEKEREKCSHTKINLLITPEFYRNGHKNCIYSTSFLMEVHFLTEKTTTIRTIGFLIEVRRKNGLRPSLREGMNEFVLWNALYR